jgi:phosphate/sulfate permease
MFGLEITVFILLFLCILAACAFEFVNGFHDTANAVATVIYTNSLKPIHAVIWSGFMNFCGVLIGGISVAMGILSLLPLELLVDGNIYHSVAMILALIVSAIIWNLGTWYFGIPASSSHTLIGSVLGIGFGFALLPGSTIGDKAVNWDKAWDTMQALAFSPFFGFGMAIILMLILRKTVTSKKIFSEPTNAKQQPPLPVRIVLITTCTLVSLAHGSNDGQKGVGLIMMILITLLPATFAVNNSLDIRSFDKDIVAVERSIAKIDSTRLSAVEREAMGKIASGMKKVKQASIGWETLKLTDKVELRKAILTISKSTKKLASSESLNLEEKELNELKAGVSHMDDLTNYAPTWVILLISISLGLGTMIGWKRIVITIGEKIGKEHLTYAQGMTAELIAATTILLSTKLGLPVSTTHVLSSGIAGSMVASKGVKNLQSKTIKHILMAWILTLPVTIILSASLFLLFRWIAG